MANTRQIKRRISTAANISKITKAMEMVSASKMRRAQQQALAARPYTRAIQRSLKKVAQFTDPSLPGKITATGLYLPKRRRSHQKSLA